MPNFTCMYGEAISLSEFPNDNEFFLFSDWQIHRLQDALVSRLEAEANEPQRQRLVNIVFTERRPRPEIVECPSCGRLAVFRSPGDQTPIGWYLPEPTTEGPPARIRDLFASKSREHPHAGQESGTGAPSPFIPPLSASQQIS
jgi:hypothetical protein